MNKDVHFNPPHGKNVKFMKDKRLSSYDLQAHIQILGVVMKKQAYLILHCSGCWLNLRKVIAVIVLDDNYI